MDGLFRDDFSWRSEGDISFFPRSSSHPKGLHCVSLHKPSVLRSGADRAAVENRNVKLFSPTHRTDMTARPERENGTQNTSITSHYGKAN